MRGERGASVRLDVVVVSYRRYDLLGACLESLRRHPPRGDMAIRVEDNGSPGASAVIADRFPEVALRAHRENLGFARASNLALRETRAPYVLVLNSDTEMTAGALDALLDLMDVRPEVGICGPRLERPDGTFDHAARRAFPTPLSALGHLSGIGPRLRRGPLAAYRAPEVEFGPVDAVNGAFMLIRRAALDAVGPFDEGYWMYMEDLDLCRRFRDAGWVTWFEPSVVVVHHKGATVGAIRGPRLQYHFHRGMGRYYRAHEAPARGAATNALVYVGIAVVGAAAVVRDGFSAVRARAAGRA